MNKHRYKNEIILLCKAWHKNADEIFNTLKKNYPNLGLGTIYRNLNELYQEGILEKIPGVNNKVIYELKKSKDDNIHGHLVCENTGRIISVDVSKIKNIDLWLPEDFDIQKIEVIFYGKYKDSDGDCKGKITMK
jgi:Fur family ferric uptake transcriptional regulator